MAVKTYPSPQRAPDYVLHRYVFGANDSLPHTVKEDGILMQDYEDANIIVVPHEDAAPAVSVLFWSEAKGAFVPEHTPVNFAAKADGVAWAARVKALGRRMFVAVTAGMAAGEECQIFVSGFNPHQD
jgi:hypothetical protein